MGAKPTVVAMYFDRPYVVPETREGSGRARRALRHHRRGAARRARPASSAPTGKLPFELPSSMDAVRAQKEDVPHDSKDPLFPYGHGLTYAAGSARR